MTTPNDIDDRIERGLRALTAWEGDGPQPPPHRLAAESEERRGAQGASRAHVPSGRWRTVGYVGAMAAVVLAVAGVFGPRLNRAQRNLSPLASAGEAAERVRVSAGTGLIEGAAAVGESVDAAGRAFGYKSGEVSPEVLRKGGFTYATGQPPVAGQPNAAAPSADRHVIHKATMELKAADVRATFLKASLIPNGGAGEFVEDSALTGEGATLSANLTLRVAAERLPEVLNQLRELGRVTGEQVRGEDVTSQVVDLDARLRNERRVEQELLGLMDTRPDAPLKEILELREKLSEVRGAIEQLDAQQSQLSRLVSLATVLVLIRPADAPAPEPQKFAILTHLSGAFKAAWRTGVEYLIDSGAWIVQVAVGGLLWWITLIAGIVIVRRYLRRAALLRGEV